MSTQEQEKQKKRIVYIDALAPATARIEMAIEVPADWNAERVRQEFFTTWRYEEQWRLDNVIQKQGEIDLNVSIGEVIEPEEEREQATFIEDIVTIDPETGGSVELRIYKAPGGGMFAIDTSFLIYRVDGLDEGEALTIPNPFADGAELVLEPPDMDDYKEKNDE